VYEVWMRKTLLHGGYRPKRDSRTITDPSTTPTPIGQKSFVKLL